MAKKKETTLLERIILKGKSKRNLSLNTQHSTCQHANQHIPKLPDCNASSLFWSGVHQRQGQLQTHQPKCHSWRILQVPHKRKIPAPRTLKTMLHLHEILRVRSLASRTIPLWVKLSIQLYNKTLRLTSS